MAMCSENPSAARGKCPPKSVALEFRHADKGKKFKKPPSWQIVPKRNPSPLGHPEALDVDLFEKHKVGKPSDVGYVQACLDGTEEAWLESQRASRTAETEETADEEEAPPPAPKADVAAQVQKAKEKAKAAVEAQKAPKTEDAEEEAPAPAPKAKAKNPPVKAAKTPAKAEAPKATPKELLAAEWWVSVEGQPADLTGNKVQEMLDGGDAPMIIAQTDPNIGWAPATKYGFVVGRSQVGRDLEDALA